LENYLLEQVEGLEGADAIVKQLTILCQKVGYAEFRLAGQLLHRLKVGDRWREHTSQPHSFDQLVATPGISKSEVSDCLTWHEVIWPYVMNELELDPQAVFATLGKSKCRRLTPILRSLIEDDFQSHSARIRRLVGQIQEQAQRAVTNWTCSQEMSHIW
jgi:hypothetical protein